MLRAVEWVQGKGEKGSDDSEDFQANKSRIEEYQRNSVVGSRRNNIQRENWIKSIFGSRRSSRSS